MKKFNLQIVCSTPNFRGIHQYSIFLHRLTSHFACSKIVFPVQFCIQRKFFGYCKQILWELFPPLTLPPPDLTIYAYPRISFHDLCFPNKSSLKGIVVYDYIQCINFSSASNFFSVLTRFGLAELLKRFMHTLLFKLSLYRTDFLIVISQVTRENLGPWIPKSSKFLNLPCLTLHPAPSFTEDNIQDALVTLRSTELDSSVRIHIVTGSAPSKQTKLLEECLSLLRQKALFESIPFSINIFGFGSHILDSLSSPDFVIHSHPNHVSQKDLIVSYLTSDIFLSTSSEEGFGIPLLDSLFFKLKCVCTPVSSFIEIAKTYSSVDNVFFAKSIRSCEVELVHFILAISNSKIFTDPQQRASNYINFLNKTNSDSALKFSLFIEAFFSGPV